jgi:hypothetical protein
MAGMPEIIGEVNLDAPEPIETDRGPAVSGGLALKDFRPTGRKSTETDVSPIKLRLLDFAGEGERAPPGA